MNLPPGPDLNDLLRADGLDQQQMQRIQQQLERLNQEMRRVLEERRPLPGRLNPNLPSGRGSGRDNGPNIRLGARVGRPSEVLVDQLDLPQGQGLVIEQLTEDSAAAKAGVKANDILLELDGKPVPDNPDDFARQLAEIKANVPVDAMVLRKGRKEVVKGLSLPEARAERPRPDVPLRGRRFPMPNLNPLAPEGAGRDRASVTMTRNNDQFTGRQQHGGEVVTVTGRVVEGKVTVEGIVVEEDRKSTKYDSIDKVPDAQRATAQKLADMALKGKVRGGR
jgi:membrane-associated protease RseP (regulator of RpoE activity)